VKKMTMKEKNQVLPRARLDAIWKDSGVIVEIPAGKEYVCVKKRGGWWPDPKHPEWQHQEILLNDPKILAQFIRALVARYNLLVREINAEAEAARMEPLTEIQEGL